MRRLHIPFLQIFSRINNWGVTQKGESSFGGLLFLFYRGLVTRDPAGSAIKGIADEAILPCYFLHEKMLKLLDILTKI